MTSARPMPQQLALDFRDEADPVTAALELQQEHAMLDRRSNRQHLAKTRQATYRNHI